MAGLLSKPRSSKRKTEVIREIPEYVEHPISPTSVWYQIPLGVGLNKEVAWNVLSHPHALLCGKAGSGKTTIQRSILAHCFQHRKNWEVIGVDLKDAELTPYLKHADLVANVATDVSDGADVVYYAHEEMMNRYHLMAELGVDNSLSLPNPPKSILVMIDETYMFLAPSGIPTASAAHDDGLKQHVFDLLLNISHMGRAAGVHLLLSSTFRDSTVIRDELSRDLTVRIAAGRMGKIASYMTLHSDGATTLPGEIRGRGYIQTDDAGEPFQGYWTDYNILDSIA